MITNRSTLLSKLESLLPGLADKKDFNSSLLNFCFVNNRICTYNNLVAISTPFDADFSCAVPATSFHALIKKLDSEFISLSSDSNLLKITTDTKVRAQINITQDDSITKSIDSIGIDVFTIWNTLPANFNDAVSQCGISVDETQLLDWMKTLNITGDTVISTDSYRISKYTMDSPLIDAHHTSIHIPFAGLEGVIGKDFMEYSISKDWFHLRTSDNLTYSIKLMEIDDMPPMDKYFSITGETFTLPEDSVKIIDMVSVMSEDDKFTKWIKISVAENTASFKCEKKGVGWVEKEVPMEYSGNPVSFFINPQAAKTILKKTREVVLSDKFCCFHTANFDHLVARIIEE